MNIRVANKSTDSFYIDKLITKFKLNRDTVYSLININGVLVYELNNKVVSTIVFAIAVSDTGQNSIIKVIGVDSLKSEYTMIMLAHISNLASMVHISKQCSRLIDIKLCTPIDSSWYNLNICYEPFKNKIFIPSRNYADGISNTVNKFKQISEHLDTLPKDRDNWLPLDISKSIDQLLNSFTSYGYGIYSFKLFSPKFCKYILDRASKLEYAVNDIEETLYQMPECILANEDIKLYEETLEMFMSNVTYITKCLYFTESKEVTSIQLAKYSDCNISKGNWHFDEDSDITLVVTLNNDFEGGGTKIKPYGSELEITIPKLEIGECLLFRGKHNLHKGLQVTKGTRHILVYWTKS